MNKTLISFLLALFFTVLFYHQSAGINMGFYAVAGLLLTSTIESNILRSPYALAFLLASVAAGYHGGAFPIFVAVCAFVVFAASLAQSRADPLLAFLWGVPNSFLAPFRLLYISGSKAQSNSTMLRKVISFGLIPLLFIVFFTALYAGANPIFEKLLLQIDWEFIRMDVFGVLIMGLSFSSILYYYYIPEMFWFMPGSDLTSGRSPVEKSTGLMAQTWTVVLVALSVLLSFVLASDLYYRYILGTLPDGLSMSDYLHRGIFSLIWSIASAIVLITFIFRRPSSAGEQISAAVFMTLNLFLLFLNLEKNFSYIGEYGLTMKRLGVYVYLLATAIGIGSTFLLILRRIQIRQLYTINSHSIFMLLLLFAFPDWSRIITRYNLQHPPLNDGTVDIKYLLRLPESNTDILLTADLPEWAEEEVYNRVERIHSRNAAKSFLSRSGSEIALAKRLNTQQHATAQ